MPAENLQSKVGGAEPQSPSAPPQAPGQRLRSPSGPTGHAVSGQGSLAQQPLNSAQTH